METENAKSHDDRASTPRSTRLAPSPTGALHLGNARTFLITWALARREGLRITLRIEDLDGPRIKPDAAAQAIDTLSWLGIDWDGAPIVQSHDLTPYRAALDTLAARALTFHSPLSRTEIESAASAPQAGVSETRFPPDLRPPINPIDRADPALPWRFLTPPGPVTFNDRFAGPQTIDPSRTIGDFVVWTNRAQPAYQLAVVVDDHRQGITDVIRGDDLLDSAARQLLLYRALGLTPEPTYTHVPLVLGPDGRRLAKRHGDTRVDTYRARAVPAEAVVGLVAFWSGISDRRAPMPAHEFMRRLRLDTIPRTPITFEPEDDRWLRSHSR